VEVRSSEGLGVVAPNVLDFIEEGERLEEAGLRFELGFRLVESSDKSFTLHGKFLEARIGILGLRMHLCSQLVAPFAKGLKKVFKP
jgi:hypothetical protein